MKNYLYGNILKRFNIKTMFCVSDSVAGDFVDLPVGQDDTIRPEVIFDKELPYKHFLFENARDGLVIINDDHKVIDANVQFCIMLGYSLDELKNMHTWDFDAQINEEEIRQSFNISKFTSITFESEHKRKDGSIYRVEISANTFNWKGEWMACCSCRDITERKKWENDLKESRERLDMFFQQSLGGFYFMMLEQPVEWNEQVDKEKILDYVFAHQRITMANEALLNQYGAKREDFIGLTPAHFYAHDIQYGRNLWKKFFDNGKLQEDTCERKFDGTPMIVTGDYICLYDEQKRIIGSFGAQREVTSERESEKYLRENEEKYRLFKTISDQANYGAMILSPEGNIVYVNQSMAQMHGRNIEELAGRNKSIFHETAQHKAAEEFLQNLLETGNIAAAQINHIRKDGTVFPVLVNANVIYDDTKKPVYISETAIDISAGKQAELLMEYQANLRELLLEMSLTFIDLPLDKVEQEIHNSLSKMAEFVGADRSYTFDYDWANQICNNIYEWCAEGIEPQIDILQNVPLEMMPDWVVAHTQGKSIYVPDVFGLPRGEVREILEPQGIKSLLAVPMMNGKKCIGFVGFDSVRYHHKYSETEQQLLTLFAQLLVNIRLRVNYESEIRAARERAEESDRLKSAFISNISHEIRTPLNGILGFGELMAQQNLAEEQRLAYLEIVQESTDRLIQTITDYMDISKIATNNLKLNYNCFKISEMLEELHHMMREKCFRKNLDIVLEYPSSDRNEKMYADQEMLRKVMEQLLGNALKFTSFGSIVFGYHINNESVNFYCRDTGIGIASDKLPVIFDAYMQEDPSITRGYEGSGLGLAIAKGIVSLHRGEIWAESEKGKGSTFYFSVPSNLHTEECDKTSFPETAVHSGNNPVVLIAEDIEMNYTFMKIALEKAGYVTLHAFNGEEAVNMCRTHPEISMVLMDIKMPVMGGIEAAALIRKHRSELAIVAVTAYDKSGEDHIILEAGCLAILSKPLRKEDLLATVRKYVGLKPPVLK